MSAKESEVVRRGPKAQRRAATRAALLRAARELFTERGYAAVGTNEIVARAGVTRGALYHHFRDKPDLFRAVYEQLEQEIVASIAQRMSAEDDPLEFLVAGVRAFLDVCTDPTLVRIGLIDGPAVLGWVEWRAIGERYALGMLIAGLERAMDTGALRRTDSRALAHLLLGTLGEAGMLIANADDPRAAREQVEQTLMTLLEGLPAPSG